MLTARARLQPFLSLGVQFRTESNRLRQRYAGQVKRAHELPHALEKGVHGLRFLMFAILPRLSVLSLKRRSRHFSKVVFAINTYRGFRYLSVLMRTAAFYTSPGNH